MKMKKSLLIVAFLAIALTAAAAPTLFSYKAHSALAYTFPYCYTDVNNDDHCFADRTQCQQSAQQAGQDKTECDSTGFHTKYTVTINGNTFCFDNKAECERNAQQYGVQCIRVNSLTC